MKFKTKFRFVHFLVFLHCWLYRHLVTCQDAGTITMVSVRVNSLDEMAGTGKFVHLCGGSLITTSVVFTGCSCISKKAPVEKDTEDKDKVELLAADQVQVYAGIAAITTNKDAAGQTSMALALNIHTLCDATFAYNYGMIKLQNSFRLENGLQLSHVLSLDMSDFEKKMMNMKAGDCWTETWVLKEGGGELIDKSTTKKTPEFTEITGKSEGTITEMVETKVAEVKPINATTEEETHSGDDDVTDDIIYTESGSSENESSGSADSTIEYGEESSSGDYTPIETISKRPGNATTPPSGTNATTQIHQDGNITTLSTVGAANTTTHFNQTAVNPSNMTLHHNRTSHVTSLVPGNRTHVINTNTTTNITNGAGAGFNTSVLGEATKPVPITNGTGVADPKAPPTAPADSPPKKTGRRRRKLYLGENIEKNGSVKLKIEEPLYLAKSRLWKREIPPGIPEGANITVGSTNASQPGVLPVGNNETEGIKGNGSTEAKPQAPNSTDIGPGKIATTIPGISLNSNVTSSMNISVRPPQNHSALIPNITVTSNGSAAINVTSKPVTTVGMTTAKNDSEGSGTEHDDYSGDYDESSGTEKDGESSFTEDETEPEESVEDSTTSETKTTKEKDEPSDEPSDEPTDEITQPAEHPTGTLPSESTPGNEPPATLDKTKPQRVSHLNVNFLDWMECTSLVCPDPSVTCDRENMDTKWCLSSAKPGIRLCTADTGAPVYCKSSMVAILSNVNLDCPKTTTKGVAVGMEGAFEYIKSTMGMPDFKKKVPPVPPVRARKASAPTIHIPINIITLIGFLLALLHI